MRNRVERKETGKDEKRIEEGKMRSMREMMREQEEGRRKRKRKEGRGKK